MDFTQQVSKEIVTTVIAASHRKPGILSSLMMRGLEQIKFAYLILNITRNFSFRLNYPLDMRSQWGINFCYKAITCDLAFFFSGKSDGQMKKGTAAFSSRLPKKKRRRNAWS